MPETVVEPLLQSPQTGCYETGHDGRAAPNAADHDQPTVEETHTLDCSTIDQGTPHATCEYASVGQTESGKKNGSGAKNNKKKTKRKAKAPLVLRRKPLEVKNSAVLQPVVETAKLHTVKFENSLEDLHALIKAVHGLISNPTYMKHHGDRIEWTQVSDLMKPRNVSPSQCQALWRFVVYKQLNVGQDMKRINVSMVSNAQPCEDESDLEDNDSIQHEVTRRRDALQERIHKYKSLLSSLSESAPDSIQTWDVDGRWKYIEDRVRADSTLMRQVALVEDIGSEVKSSGIPDHDPKMLNRLRTPSIDGYEALDMSAVAPVSLNQIYTREGGRVKPQVTEKGEKKSKKQIYKVKKLRDGQEREELVSTSLFKTTAATSEHPLKKSIERLYASTDPTNYIPASSTSSTNQKRAKVNKNKSRSSVSSKVDIKLVGVKRKKQTKTALYGPGGGSKVDSDFQNMRRLVDSVWNQNAVAVPLNGSNGKTKIEQRRRGKRRNRKRRREESDDDDDDQEEEEEEELERQPQAEEDQDEKQEKFDRCEGILSPLSVEPAERQQVAAKVVRRVKRNNKVKRSNRYVDDKDDDEKQEDIMDAKEDRDVALKTPSKGSKKRLRPIETVPLDQNEKQRYKAKVIRQSVKSTSSTNGFPVKQVEAVEELVPTVASVANPERFMGVKSNANLPLKKRKPEGTGKKRKKLSEDKFDELVNQVVMQTKGFPIHKQQSSAISTMVPNRPPVQQLSQPSHYLIQQPVQVAPSSSSRLVQSPNDLVNQVAQDQARWQADQHLSHLMNGGLTNVINRGELIMHFSGASCQQTGQVSTAPTLAALPRPAHAFVSTMSPSPNQFGNRSMVTQPQQFSSNAMSCYTEEYSNSPLNQFAYRPESSSSSQTAPAFASMTNPQMYAIHRSDQRSDQQSSLPPARLNSIFDTYEMASKKVPSRSPQSFVSFSPSPLSPSGTALNSNMNVLPQIVNVQQTSYSPLRVGNMSSSSTLLPDSIYSDTSSHLSSVSSAMAAALFLTNGVYNSTDSSLPLPTSSFPVGPAAALQMSARQTNEHVNGNTTHTDASPFHTFTTSGNPHNPNGTRQHYNNHF